MFSVFHTSPLDPDQTIVLSLAHSHYQIHTRLLFSVLHTPLSDPHQTVGLSLAHPTIRSTPDCCSHSCTPHYQIHTRLLFSVLHTHYQIHSRLLFSVLHTPLSDPHQTAVLSLAHPTIRSTSDRCSHSCIPPTPPPPPPPTPPPRIRSTRYYCSLACTSSTRQNLLLAQSSTL